MKKIDSNYFEMGYGNMFFKCISFPEDCLRIIFKTPWWPIKNVLFDSYFSWK